MPELVTRGHIYIAQPPLYKVKKGKQEVYAKDDDALYAYLLQLALDGSKLYPNASAPAISDQALGTLANDLYRAERSINRLGIHYPKFIVQQLKYSPALAADDLLNEAFMQNWIAALNALIHKNNGDISAKYAIKLKFHEENKHYFPVIVETKHGFDTETVLKDDFFRSQDYAAISRFAKTSIGFIEAGARVVRGEQERKITAFEDAYEWLLAQSKKGLAISRYKGLGEMNPEQLWETTMDPAVRRLLKVTIEDAVQADQIFTTLMGDAVEPRRQFIEDNALSASNIDA